MNNKIVSLKDIQNMNDFGMAQPAYSFAQRNIQTFLKQLYYLFPNNTYRYLRSALSPAESMGNLQQD